MMWKRSSFTPAKGVLTDIWIEEATETAYEDLKQLEKRLRGESRHKSASRSASTRFTKSIGSFANSLGAGLMALHPTVTATSLFSKQPYRDNRFLTDDDRAALENETDPYYKAVIPMAIGAFWAMSFSATGAWRTWTSSREAGR